MKIIRYVLYGILMGAANVIPGVSGGTIAVVLNFYDRLMSCITFNFKKLFQNMDFLIPLGIGLVVGVLGLSKVMGLLFTDFPTQTYFAFIGIIAGSLPLIFHKATQHQKNINMSSKIAFIVCFLFMFAMMFASGDKNDAAIRYTSLTPESFIMCFISVAIAASTMIIPGISGSMMLLIMGMYGTIVGFVVAQLNIPLLIPSVLGGVSGIFGGAKLISMLLKKYEQPTYMAIGGLLVGSILELLKRSDVFGAKLSTILISLGLALIMFAIVYSFSKQEIKSDLEKGEKE